MTKPWPLSKRGLILRIYLTHMPGGVTVVDSGLCCCVPCLRSAITSFCLQFGDSTIQKDLNGHAGCDCLTAGVDKVSPEEFGTRGVGEYVLAISSASGTSSDSSYG